MSQSVTPPSKAQTEAVPILRRKYFEKYGTWPKLPDDISTMSKIGKCIGDLREALGMRRESTPKRSPKNVKSIHITRGRNNSKWKLHYGVASTVKERLLQPGQPFRFNIVSSNHTLMQYRTDLLLTKLGALKEFKRFQLNRLKEESSFDFTEAVFAQIAALHAEIDDVFNRRNINTSGFFLDEAPRITEEQIDIYTFMASKLGIERRQAKVRLFNFLRDQGAGSAKERNDFLKGDFKEEAEAPKMEFKTTTQGVHSLLDDPSVPMEFYEFCADLFDTTRSEAKKIIFQGLYGGSPCPMKSAAATKLVELDYGELEMTYFTKLATKFLESFEVSLPTKGLNYTQYPRVLSPELIAKWFLANQR